MPNYKLYYVSQSNFDSQIRNAKLPLQQIQIYRALAKLGVPTRGEDVIKQAVKPVAEGGEGLITRQNFAVLAAWYFSEKRRHPAVTLGVPTVVEEDLEDKITRLTAEMESKANELADAEAALLKRMEDEANAETKDGMAENDMADIPPETKQLEDIVEESKSKKNKRAHA